LNHLPEVRRFLKEPGHADAYRDLKVTFIAGKTPELFLYDGSGTQTEKIDLSGKTADQLHALMLEKGFDRKPSGTLPTKSKRALRSPG